MGTRFLLVEFSELVDPLSSKTLLSHASFLDDATEDEQATIPHYAVVRPIMMNAVGDKGRENRWTMVCSARRIWQCVSEVSSGSGCDGLPTAGLSINVESIRDTWFLQSDSNLELSIDIIQ
ncbi:hypothetical protein J6590_052101 [Homalodisca vitripennis]|nr:hypothetical protein J6590_052101 [Homalodisca vitripennis]